MEALIFCFKQTPPRIGIIYNTNIKITITTILMFTNYFNIGSPVMPLAVNIHERKFKSSHSLFWARVLCDIPALAKYRCVTFATMTIITILVTSGFLL